MKTVLSLGEPRSLARWFARTPRRSLDSTLQRRDQRKLIEIYDTPKRTRSLREGAVAGDNFSIVLDGGELSLLDRTYVGIEHNVVCFNRKTLAIETHLIRARRWGCTAGHLSP